MLNANIPNTGKTIRVWTHQHIQGIFLQRQLGRPASWLAVPRCYMDHQQLTAKKWTVSSKAIRGMLRQIRKQSGRFQRKFNLIKEKTSTLSKSDLCSPFSSALLASATAWSERSANTYSVVPLSKTIVGWIDTSWNDIWKQYLLWHKQKQYLTWRIKEKSKQLAPLRYFHPPLNKFV